MSKTQSLSAKKVQKAISQLGFSHKVIELVQATRTAVEAAQAVGCQIGQIAKSLVFKTQHSNKPILVIASGVNRVNEEIVGKIVGESIQMAGADFVREKTGFAIGGVPPIGHKERIETFIDEDLLQYEEIWAAGGNPRAVFKLTPSDLVRMTGGRVVSIK